MDQNVMDVLAGRLPDLLLRLALVRLQRQPRGLPQQAPRPPGQSLHPQGRGAHHQLHLTHLGKDLGLDQISMQRSLLQEKTFETSQSLGRLKRKFRVWDVSHCCETSQTLTMTKTLGRLNALSYRRDLCIASIQC